MEIHIPKPLARTWDKTMNWLACHLLPPPKPIGVTFMNTELNLADVGICAWGVVGAMAMYALTGNWYWVLAVGLMLIFAATLMPR